MTSFNPYKWGVRVGGMVVFLMATTAAVITLNCSLGDKTCDRAAIDSLWNDSLVGALAVMAATAGHAAAEVLSKERQTTGRLRASARPAPPET